LSLTDTLRCPNSLFLLVCNAFVTKSCPSRKCELFSSRRIIPQGFPLIEFDYVNAPSALTGRMEERPCLVSRTAQFAGCGERGPKDWGNGQETQPSVYNVGFLPLWHKGKHVDSGVAFRLCAYRCQCSLEVAGWRTWSPGSSGRVEELFTASDALCAAWHQV